MVRSRKASELETSSPQLLMTSIHSMANQSCGIGCSFQLGFGGSSAGVFVLKVRDGGPADVAGINPGDRLLGFFLDSKVLAIFAFLSLFPAL